MARAMGVPRAIAPTSPRQMAMTPTGGTLHLLESGRRPRFSFGVVVSVALHGTAFALYLIAQQVVIEPPRAADQLVAFFAPPDQPKGEEGPSSDPQWSPNPRPVGAGGPAPATSPVEPVALGPLASGELDTLPTREEVDPLLELVGESVLTELEVDSMVRRDPESAPPEYPPDLLSRNIEGSAFVLYIVDSTGRVDLSSYRVVRASHPGFAAAVQRALAHMKFSPAVLDGQAVRQLVQQNFAFRIRPPASQKPPGPEIR
jgi:TonB family protein